MVNEPSQKGLRTALILSFLVHGFLGFLLRPWALPPRGAAPKMIESPLAILDVSVVKGPATSKLVQRALEPKPVGSSGAGGEPKEPGESGDEKTSGHGSFNVAAWRVGNPAPVYPRLSRLRGEEGRVVLEVVLKTDGSLVSVTVKESSGHALLDKAALEAVKGWHFPSVLAAPILLLPFRFSLTSLHETNKE